MVQHTPKYTPRAYWQNKKHTRMKTQIAMDFNIGTIVFFPKVKKNRKYGLELGTNTGFS